MPVICVGLDWAEDHHDVAVMTPEGAAVAELRIADSLEGVQQLHVLLADHVADPSEVIIGVETVDGLVPRALIAAGYVVYEINPVAANRYRGRHHLSGAKSDRADAKMLADIVRTDRQNHRAFAGDTELLESIAVIARAHQSLIWNRQDHLNRLRSTLRQYYPGMMAAFPGLCAPSNRDCAEALRILERAPTPDLGRSLTDAQIKRSLRAAGRQRGFDARVAQTREQLRAPRLGRPSMVTDAYGVTVRAAALLIMSLSEQIAQLEDDLSRRFEQHPDAEIYRSLPGLGLVLGARALAEFGDRPNRFPDAKARKNYATTAPVTKASGKLKVVGARHSGNRQLGSVCRRWAFCSMTSSPGARRYYDQLRGRGKNDAQARLALANRLVGMLHGCLVHRAVYSEDVAWPQVSDAAAA